MGLVPRAQNPATPQQSWEARITDDPEWKTQLWEHFRSIFAKEHPTAVRQRAKELRDQLSVKCKATPWHPFREDELRPIMAKWKNNKSTGTDRISLEAVRYISLVRGWLGRLLWLLNDILYVSKLLPGLDDGLAVLLPKVAAPQEFADTRPITLSNILLKTLAQLLLRRGLPLLRPIGNLQFCKTGSQSVELILALRRLAQQAHEWRETFWIIKLDVRRLPDSPSLFSAGIGEAIDQVIQDMAGTDIRGDHPRLPPAPFAIGVPPGRRPEIR